MKETFDVAIVGAGPAGISAACILASAGVKTIVLERGEFAGAKNVSGAVCYGHDLAQVLPDYLQRGCPIERNIIETRICYLSKDGGYTIAYRDAVFSAERKNNSFTVLRAKFDRWFADQARQKGALVVPGTVVVDLLRDANGRVEGVLTSRQDGDVKAKVVLIADGVNSPLAVKTGFRSELKPEHVALAVKEIIEMTPDVIDQRFNVSGGNGVTAEILGDVIAGMDGIAALYTNKSSLSLSIGANLADFAAAKIKPYELIESFKLHPVIAPLIAGGQSREYMAHWLAEGGYNTMPRLYGDGYLIAGDSAMLFNALHREGNNLAMASGKLAAETIIEVLGRKDFTSTGLASYAERMADSFVLKDMKKYRGFGHFLYTNKVIFNELPAAASMAAREMLTVDGTGKKQKQKLIMKQLKQKISLWAIAKLLWKGLKAVR